MFGNFFKKRSSVEQSTLGSVRLDWRRRTFRKLRVEQLEDRSMLSGDAIGDTFDMAQHLNLIAEVPAIISAEIAPSNDVDMFVFEAEESSKITLITRQPPGGRSFDPYLTLFDDSEVNILTSNDNDPSTDAGYAAIYEFPIPETGTYYVELRSRFNSHLGSRGDYELTSLLTPPPLRDISVAWNGTEFINGATTIASYLGTDFGIVDASVPTEFRTTTFTIINHGSQTLHLSGDSPVEISGPEAADFSVVTQPSSAVNGHASTTFEIAFNPRELGLRRAIVSVSSDDPDEDPFTFTIAGTGTTDSIGDTLDSAQSLTIDPDTQVRLTEALTAADVDMFAFTASAGSKVSFRTRQLDVSSYFYFQADVRLFNAAGTMLTSGDPAISDFIIPESGLYYLGVASSDNDAYDPSVAFSGVKGVTGKYELLARMLPVIDISVLGNGRPIADGALETDNANATDFGNVPIAGGARTNSFTITNLGTLPLNLTGTPRVEVSGAAAADFTVVMQPDSPITDGDSSSFQIAFAPTALGRRSATITIASDDPSTGIYEFAIEGQGTVDLIGDTLSAARLVNVHPAVPSIVAESISPANDVDLFSFQAAAGNAITITTRRPAGGERLDAYLRLFDAAGVELAANDDSAGDRYAQIKDFVITATGTYHVGVSGFPNAYYDPTAIHLSAGVPGGTGDYELSVELAVTSPPPEIEVHVSNQPILNGDTTPSSADGTDFGTLDLVTGSRINQFTIANSGVSALQLSGTPRVQISGPAAGDFQILRQPETNLTSQSSSTFAIFFNPTMPGRRVATISIPTNDPDESVFTFTIQGNATTDLIGDTLRTAKLLTLAPGAPTIVKDEISASRDVDMFSFQGAAGNVVSISGRQLPGATGFDSYLRLFDANGIELMADDDSAGGFYPAISGYSLPKSGWYFVGMSSVGNRYYDPTLAGGGVEGTLGEYELKFALGSTQALTPAIDVRSESSALLNEDMDPTDSYAANFYSTRVGDIPYSRTFTITNPGSGPLHLQGNPKVQISGPASGDFTIDQQPDAVVAPGASIDFHIAFAPSVVGLRTATISILSDAPNAPEYRFAITGTGEQPWSHSTLATAYDNPSYGSGQYDYYELYDPTDVALFALPVVKDTTITLTTLPYTDPPLDTYLRLFDADGNELAANDDDTFGSAVSGIRNFPIRETTTYYFGVSGAANRRYDPKSGENREAGEFGRFSLQLDVATPTVIVRGGSQEIVDGDTTPDLTEGNAFGNVDIIQGKRARSFSLEGNLALALIGSPHVQISGPAAGDFSVSQQPELHNGAATFTIVFDPSVMGVRRALVSIANNAPEHGAYHFVIEGIGIEGALDQGDGNDSAQYLLLNSDAITTASGSISTPTDLDVFAFEIQEPGFRTLVLRQPAGGVPLDALMRVASAEQALVSDDDSAGNLYPAIRNYEFVQPGLYYVTISGYPNFPERITSGAMGDYELSIEPSSLIPPPSPPPPPPILTSITILGARLNNSYGGELIANGDTTPSTTDGTDFGAAEVGGRSGDFLFNITRTGDPPINLTGNPFVQIAGPAAADFVVVSQPDSSGSGFYIHFSPSAVGSREATIVIETDDPDRGTYSFAIRGDGVVDVGNVLDSAILMTPSTYYYTQAVASASLSPANDVDLFAFHASIGQAVTFATAPFATSYFEPPPQDQVETVIRLFDATGAELSVSVPGYGLFTSQIDSFPIPVTGTYYLGISSRENDSYDPAQHVDGPGGSIGRYTLSALILSPSMKVGFGDVVVADGGTTTTTADGTEFGTAFVSTSVATVAHAFTIYNDWYGTRLNLFGDPQVSITGPAAADFSVIVQPPEVISYDDRRPFQVVFEPTAPGIRTATISILNNSSEGGSYEFVVQGTGVAPVEVSFESTASAVVGYLTNREQRDLYAFELTAGELFTAHARSLGEAANVHLDSRLTFYDADGRQLAYGDNSGPDQLDAGVAFVVATSGRYYLEFRAPGIDQSIFRKGAYEIALQRQPGTVSGSITAQQNEYTQEIFLPQSGRLDLSLVGAAQLIARLSLKSGDGDLLATAAENSTGQNVKELSQFVVAGRYLLSVTGDRNSTGNFQLTAGFSGATSPLDRLHAGSWPSAIAMADFNGDGLLDLAIGEIGSFLPGSYNPGISILLGRGDGSFSESKHISLQSGVYTISVADLNSDGRVDIVAGSARDVVVLLGRGDGSFNDQIPTRVGAQYNSSIALADFNEDGRLDIAVAAGYFSGIRVLLALGDGTFSAQQQVSGSGSANQLTARDLDADGDIDLITDTGNVYFGLGDGTFQEGDPIDGMGIANADFNEDGRIDSVGWIGNQLGVRLAQADGSYAAPLTFTVGIGPSSLVTGDFNGDDHLDVAVANTQYKDISILLGRGDGTFLDQQLLPIGASSTSVYGGPWSFPIAAGDLNNDGRADLVAAYDSDTTFMSDVVVFLSRSDGSLVDPLQRFAVGILPQSIAVGEFNGDGRPDLAIANPRTAISQDIGEISLLLGRGDGSFENRRQITVPRGTRAVGVGDYNGDGRADLLVEGDDNLILLGRGDGSFETGEKVPVIPDALFDFNSDGYRDQVIVNPEFDDVSVLLGRSDGSFEADQRYSVGHTPASLVIDDFNGDGRSDLAVANSASGDISILLGRGDGSFEELGRFAVLSKPEYFTLGDFNGDDWSDLIVSSSSSGAEQSLLLGLGDGTFEREKRVSLENGVLIVGDFNGDQISDLAIISSSYYIATSPGVDLNFVSVFLGRGDGSFGEAQKVSFDKPFTSLTLGDFNQDGRSDLILIRPYTNDLLVLLGQSSGVLVPVNNGSLRNITVNPVRIGDVNGDHLADTATVDREGRIIIRLATVASSFASPVVINEGMFAGRDLPAARDLALFRAYDGTARVAAIDRTTDALSIYRLASDGSVLSYDYLVAPVGSLLARLNVADINGDGNEDVLVSNPGLGVVNVLVAGSDGTLTSSLWTSYETGSGALDLAVADVNLDGRIDMVVGNQVSGDASIYLNIGNGRFGFEQRQRVTTGVAGFGTDLLAGRPAIQTADQTNVVRVADFTGDGLPDILAVNTRAREFTITVGRGEGRFAVPQSMLTSGEQSAAAVGDFNHDGHIDAAFLDPTRAAITVYLGQSGGVLASMGGAIPVGHLPTSIQVYDVNGPQGGEDGVLDLIVGNEFGDVLILQGNGNGTFRSFVRADKSVALAVADLDGNGQPEFIYSNKSLDRLFVDFGQTAAGFERDRQHGLLSPGAVYVADMNGDGLSDMVMANSGGNNVLVFLARAHRQVGDPEPFLPPRAFFTGTNPTGLTIQNVDDDLDRLPDLVVANSGSNDVTLLLGHGTGDSWTLVNGPRLKAGLGPVSTAVKDVTGPNGIPDGIPDIAVSNQQSNNVMVLPGVGGGFFNDGAPILFPTGSQPNQVFFVGANLVAVNTGSNSISVFSGFEPLSRVDFTSGGIRPFAAAVGDANFDGFSDLFVANNGDGVISLFLGGPNGLALADSFVNSQLTHPTSLAFGANGLFGAGEGRDAAVLLFGFDRSDGLVTLVGRSIVSVDFQPLKNSALALVATLLTVSAFTLMESGDGVEEGDSEDGSGGEDVEEVKEPTLEELEGERLGEEQRELLHYWIDLKNALRTNNRRLIQKLLGRGRPLGKLGFVDQAILDLVAQSPWLASPLLIDELFNALLNTAATADEGEAHSSQDAPEAHQSVPISATEMAPVHQSDASLPSQSSIRLEQVENASEDSVDDVASSVGDSTDQVIRGPRTFMSTVLHRHSTAAYAGAGFLAGVCVPLGFSAWFDSLASHTLTTIAHLILGT